MTACDRFEKEGLLALERGEALDKHFEDCPDCRRAHTAYTVLREEIHAIGSQLHPPDNWRAKVWSRIDQRQRHRRWLRFSWLLAPATAVAALAMLIAIQPEQEPPLVSLEVSIEAGTRVRRGIEAQPGDTLTLTGSIGSNRHAELRVYRNEIELLLRCASEAPCVRREHALHASLILKALGTYQSLFLVSDRPPPEPQGNLDRDTAAVLAAGAEVEFGDEVVVR